RRLGTGAIPFVDTAANLDRDRIGAATRRGVPVCDRHVQQDLPNTATAHAALQVKEINRAEGPVLGSRVPCRPPRLAAGLSPRRPASHRRVPAVPRWWLELPTAARSWWSGVR